MWQDVVLTVVGLVFTISLLPQVIHGFRKRVGPVRFWTSVPTAVGLYVMTFAYATLELYFAATMAFITGTLWLLLVIQRLRFR